MDAVSGVPYEQSAEYKKEHNEYGQKGEFRNYEIKDAARTITEAEEIKKNPKIMKYVEKCLKMKAQAAQEAVNSLDDLRRIGQKKMKEEINSGYKS